MVQHGAMSSAPGTFRISDGSKVEFAEALDLWVPLAYDALVETARHYNRVDHLIRPDRTCAASLWCPDTNADRELERQVAGASGSTRSG